MNHEIENHMVLPYADDDPIDEPQEREYDKHLDSVDEDYAEPEDNFSLSVRLTMAINRIANTNSFDKEQLIQVLKDAKQMTDSHTDLITTVENATDEIRGRLIGKPQA